MIVGGKGRRISLRQRLHPAPFRGAVLKGWIRDALDHLGTGRADLRILIVGDAEMTRWNRRFLGKACTTNVISFPEEGYGEGSPDGLYGDILVSAPTCLAQTNGWPESPEGRIFFFILHGMLHLLGHDHLAGRREAARMRRAELRIFRQVLHRSSARG